MKNKFSNEIIDQLNNYVYRLIDPRNGVTFYVGRGVGNRIFQHVEGVLKLPEDTIEDDVSLKIGLIQEIHKAGLEVEHIIHRHNLEYSVAIEVEAALIDAYPGVTNINGGYGSDFGPLTTAEIITRYGAEIAQLKHNVIMITINRTIKKHNIYDATRFAWKINVERAKKADYILSVEKGLIVGIFRVKEWKLARRQYFPEFSNFTNSRYGFIGIEADNDIRDMYLKKRIPDEFRKKGAAFPIKYNYK